VSLPVADQYQLLTEAFSNAVRTQKPDAAGLDEAAGGMRVIDALFASEKSGRFERP
jgi:predicted dehydrogenase